MDACWWVTEGMRPGKQTPRGVVSASSFWAQGLWSCRPGHVDSSSLRSPLRSRSCDGSGSFGHMGSGLGSYLTQEGQEGIKRNMLLALRHLDKNPERRQNYLTGEVQRHVGCHPQLPSSRCHQFREDLSALISLGEVVMCVSNYSFQRRHHLYHRLLRYLLPGLWEARGPESGSYLQETSSILNKSWGGH